MEAQIKILKKRLSLFKKLMKVEEKQIGRLKYKSRSVRLSSPNLSRNNWYQDRMQELSLTISYLEGKTSEKDYVRYLLNDALGSTLVIMGNACVNK